jgi:hypothetical protein
MERIAVSSSNVGAIGYEAEISTLEVEFNNGSVYQYHGVPQEVYDSFMQADSKGTFLNTRIKGSYGYTKL